MTRESDNADDVTDAGSGKSGAGLPDAVRVERDRPDLLTERVAMPDGVARLLRVVLGMGDRRPSQTTCKITRA